MTEYEIIAEPNYTQIPNVFFDYWMDKLTPAEYKVLMCVARKTFGWQGKNGKDNIALSQIVNMTGISKSGVVKSLIKLEELKLIVKHRNSSAEHGYEASTYQIFVLTPAETKNTVASALSAQGGACPLSAQGLVHSVHIQKKDSIKESKKPPQPPLKKDLNPPKPVVVFPILESIPGLPANLAQKLTEDFTEEQLENAVGVMDSSTAHIDKPYGWLRDCIEQGWESPARSKDCIQKNKRIMSDRFHRLDGLTIGGELIGKYNEYVEFLRGGALNCADYIRFDDPHFELKMEEKIKQLHARGK